MFVVWIKVCLVSFILFVCSCGIIKLELSKDGNKLAEFIENIALFISLSSIVSVVISIIIAIIVYK
jgi:hypothetical protein